MTDTPNTREAKEIVEGYVMDIGCIRKYRRRGLLPAARTHTRRCGLMGHCIESGYGLVTEDDRLHLLDDTATLKVASLLAQIQQEAGIRLRVTREPRGAEMRTTNVELLAGSK
jgi:hypothetical protein